ncbi:hypothetical protein MTO96_035616 [Rhipicephalus appendiculatus]
MFSFSSQMMFTYSLKPGKVVQKATCAIDNIELHDCVGTTTPKERKCDFEDGWCTWKNNNTSINDLAWMLGGEYLKTTLLRPNHDHTYGNGTATSRGTQGDKGDLIGEVLFSSGSITQCVEFWYDINGDKETTLQLVFRGAVGPASEQAYIALDDISIHENDRCETLPQGADDLDAGELLSCGFERESLCHWNSKSTAGATAWTFGPPANSSLGPLQSPEDKDGMIYLTRSALPKQGNPVLLTSAAVGPQTEASCFSFWYHMFGGDGAELELYLKKSVRSAGAPWKNDMLFTHNDRTTTDRWYNVRRTVFPR